jgi:hypothetical protein
MNELPISSPYRSTPDAPVTESERNALNARLNAAFEAGALDSDDFAGRLDRLFAAQRLGELVPVVEGLPPLPTYNGPSFGGAGGTPGQLSESRNATRPALLVVGVLVAVVLLVAILLLILF